MLALSRSLSGSLSDGKKVKEERRGCWFYQRLEWVLVDFKFHQAGRLQLMAATGEAMGINATEEEDRKAERG